MKYKLQILILIILSTFLISGCTEMKVLEAPPGGQVTVTENATGHYLLTCGENAALDPSAEWSCGGNGETEQYVYIERDLTLTGLGLSCNDGTGEANITIEEETTGYTTCSILSTGTLDNSVCNTTIPANSWIRPYTISDTGHSACVITITGEYDIEVNVLKGDQGIQGERGASGSDFIEKYYSGNFEGSLYTKNATSTTSVSNSLFQVISDTRGTPQFLVQDGGPYQASFIARSFLVVNQNNTLLNMSQNNDCRDWGFKHLDCNTATTGADFGVTDDIEALGRIFSNEGLRSHTTEHSAYLVLGDKNKLYTGSNGYFNSSINTFCDYDANNFVDTAESEWVVITQEDSDYNDARADISAYLNTSCVELKNNPAWLHDFGPVSYAVNYGVNMISQKGGFFEYYVGDDEESKFKIKGQNVTSSSTFYIDTKTGDNQHQGFTLDYEMGNYEGQIGMGLIMKKGEEQIVDKDLTMLFLEGEATNMNNSRGVFIDMEVIGQPLTLEGSIDGIHMSPNMNNLIKVGSPDTISRAYSNEVDITADVFDSTSTAPVFNNDNDVVYVGATLNFTTMGFVLDTESNRNVNLVYYYCDSTGTWQTLTGITDSTNGFQVGGTITFNNPSDRGVCNTEIDGTPFADTNNYAYIGLQRTRNNVGTTPVIETISISGASVNMFMTEDLLKLYPVNTAPQTCTTTTLGAIYFDISEDDMCQCASGGWEVIRDGSACT